jgi:4'-phosphopantetheinyl transferase
MLQPDSADVAPMHGLLDLSEQTKADRFRMAADRDAYIAAHALLRTTLSSFIDTAPGDWRFQIDVSGKPELELSQAPPHLHFSLSHTRGLAACAVGWPHALGIDAEKWRSPAPIELATRYFAPSEARLLATQAPTQQTSTFYRLWTLKEAYLKAIGQGLAAPLDGFSFTLDPAAITIAGQRATSTAWQFVEFQPGPTHSLALAVQTQLRMQVDGAAISVNECLGHHMEELRRRGTMRCNRI